MARAFFGAILKSVMIVLGIMIPARQQAASSCRSLVTTQRNHYSRVKGYSYSADSQDAANT